MFLLCLDVLEKWTIIVHGSTIALEKKTRNFLYCSRYIIFFIYIITIMTYNIVNFYLALHCCYVITCIIFVCQSICLVFTFRMEAMFLVFTSCNSSVFDIFRFWSIALCHIYYGHVCHSTTSHMLRWNGTFIVISQFFFFTFYCILKCIFLLVTCFKIKLL